MQEPQNTEVILVTCGRHYGFRVELGFSQKCERFDPFKRVTGRMTLGLNTMQKSRLGLCWKATEYPKL